jgi:hypothetical protein
MRPPAPPCRAREYSRNGGVAQSRVSRGRAMDSSSAISGHLPVG